MQLFLQLLWLLLRLFLVIALPFFALLRTTTWLYLDKSWFWVPAMVGGMLTATLVVSLYAWGVKELLGVKQRSLRWLTGFSFLLVLGYTLYTTSALSSQNLKHQNLQQEFGQLHPILRLGTGTLVLIDSDLLVTDLSRTPADYRRMGLPPKQYSLHFVQKDGYAHALDLRTQGRFELANFLTEAYFRLAGFGTLRHVGTADHLHVSLAPHENPDAL